MTKTEIFQVLPIATQAVGAAFQPRVDLIEALMVAAGKPLPQYNLHIESLTDKSNSSYFIL